MPYASKRPPTISGGLFCFHRIREVELVCQLDRESCVIRDFYTLFAGLFPALLLFLPWLAIAPFLPILNFHLIPTLIQGRLLLRIK